MNAADVVKTIPLESDDALLAAGAKKLVIAYPGARRLERWDLGSLKRDGELRPSPIDGVLQVIAMGSDSDGPLFAYWCAPQTNPREMQKARSSFIDLESLKVLKVALVSSPDPHLSASGGCFLADITSTNRDVRLCASAGGTVFGVWAASDSPADAAPTILQADGRTISGLPQLRARSFGIGYVIPGADGRTVFTSRTGIITDRKFAENVPSRAYIPQEAPVFPSPDPAYYLSLQGGGSISLHVARDSTRLLTVTALEEMVGIPGIDQSLVYDRISVEKRFHLVPAAKLLVTIPTTNDRLVLRRVDISETLARLPGEFLFVTSPAVVGAKAGQPFQHQIDVMSKRGGLSWALNGGPKGMSISTHGVLSWLVPRDLKDAEETAVVGISDASGRKALHKLTIQVE